MASEWVSVERLVEVAEQAVAGAQDERVDQQDVLVDQVGDRADQFATAEDDQVLFGSSASAMSSRPITWVLTQSGSVSVDETTYFCCLLSASV